MIHIDPVLKEIAHIFSAHQKKVYLVGGAVRDMLRKKSAHDWDLASDALCDEVCLMFRRVVKTGIKHGTVTVLYKGHAIEVTTFRTEADYTDGRRPDTVQFTATIEEDLSRRDFTMNAVAVDLVSGKISDPFDGAEDIKKKIIRCVGNAEDRLSEDGLRSLRALRFSSVLNFTVDDAILAAIPRALGVTAKVSSERIRDEFEKIILSQKPSLALNLMAQTGLTRMLLPELADCIGVEQKGYHHFDVHTHSVLACDYAAKQQASKEVRLAALLHDIGKPQAAKLDERGIWTFYNHEKISARLVRDMLFRLRFPNGVIDKTVHLVAEHMFHYEDEWRSAAVRRFIARVGEENLEDLFALRSADTFGMAGIEPDPRSLLPLRLRIEDVLAKSCVLSLKNLAVNGSDLLSMGIPTGKRIGIILNQLLEAVLEDPELNTRGKLLEIAGKLG
ncbi:MAG: HD domain-containing protein [Spirochaetaceae bacterium]|jgi:putative nucleotidyltransferase with HDIG domain|nr:HD domain-containing protein [Spirochaetaceae bacterium]